MTPLKFGGDVSSALHLEVPQDTESIITVLARTSSKFTLPDTQTARLSQKPLPAFSKAGSKLTEIWPCA
jgi:hypothetical protein